jgi:hypothetical protein
MTEPEEPRHLYVVAGGTPAARAVIEALESPEAQAALRESFERMAYLVGQTVAEVSRAFAAAAAVWRAAMPDLDRIRDHLVDAGVIDRPLPTDPRGRALELRRRRSTGPDRQVQHRKRPRRIA